MKMVPGLALAAALVTGAASLPATPARAADAAVTMSPTVRTALVSARAAFNASPRDLAAADAAIGQIEAGATSDYERYLGQSLRLSLEGARSQSRGDLDRANLLGPLLDAVIANPATPKDEIAQRLYERGNLAYTARKSADAVQFYVRARDAGYIDPELQLAVVRAKYSAGDVRGASADLAVAVQAEQAAGRKAPELWYRLAIANLQRANAVPELEQWTRLWLVAYGTPANWREAVTNFGLTGANAARFEKNRLDLYRLLYATKGLAGEKDCLDYATVALATPGSVEETRTVLKEGAAAGALKAGNAAATALQKSATTKLTRVPSAPVREKAALAGKSADLARAAGDAYFSTRNFTKAAEMYRLAATRGGGDADRTNLHLGMALALAGNRDEAQTALAQVAGEPYAPIARLWMIYVATPPAA